MLLVSQNQVPILPDSDKKSYIPILFLRLNPSLVPGQGLQDFSKLLWKNYKALPKYKPSFLGNKMENEVNSIFVFINGQTKDTK